jgi:hypothetical protein
MEKIRIRDKHSRSAKLFFEYNFYLFFQDSLEVSVVRYGYPVVVRKKYKLLFFVPSNFYTLIRILIPNTNPDVDPAFQMKIDHY